MVPVLAVLGLLVLLVMAQPDMGTALVLSSIAVAMMVTAGMPIRPLAGVLGAGAGAFHAASRWRRPIAGNA